VDSPAWQPFSVTVSSHDGSTRVALKGELDLAGVDRADEALREAESLGMRLVVLDMAELTFVDSTGLEVILRAARRAQGNGSRLVLARPAPHVRKLLQLTAIDQSLDVVDDVV